MGQKIAWSYLIVTLASLSTMVSLIIGVPLIGKLCAGSTNELCSLAGLVIYVWVFFLVMMAVFTAWSGLGVWYWLCFAPFFSGFVMWAQIAEWWWWLALLVLPALLSVLVSHPWRTGRAGVLPPVQKIVIAVLAMSTVAGLVFWFFAG